MVGLQNILAGWNPGTGWHRSVGVLGRGVLGQVAARFCVGLGHWRCCGLGPASGHESHPRQHNGMRAEVRMNRATKTRLTRSTVQ